MNPQSHTIMTLQLSAEAKERLERLSEATSRSISWLVVDALSQYLQNQESQLAEIKEGIHEANNGEFASDEEQAAVKSKRRHHKD